MSARFGRFFLPGPTEVLPEVLAAQDRPMMGHRGAGYRALKDTTFRIGHMGDHTVAGVETVLTNIEEVIRGG